MAIPRLRSLSFVTLVLAGTSGLLAQGTSLPAEVQKALEARRAEIDRMQKASTSGQSPLAMMPSRLRAEAGPIAETRSSIGAGSLNIQLVVYTEEIPANAYIRRHEITNATDDQGRPVLPSTNPGPGLSLQPRGEAPRLTRPLIFQSPARRTESIKSIEGFLEVFVPSEETSSVVRFPSLAASSGKPLSHAILSKHQIEGTVLTKEMYDSLKPQWEKSAASVAPPPNFAAAAVLLVTDKGNRFSGVELRDQSGNVIPTNVQTMSTNVLGTSLVVARTFAPLAADPELRIFVADPASIRTFPFRLENLVLP